MKKFTIVATAMLSLCLSACVAPIDNAGAVVMPVPIGVPIPVLVTEKEKNDSMHVCKIQAFTSTYTAENQRRGKARLDVKKKCTANHHEMFCRDQDIKCEEYK